MKRLPLIVFAVAAAFLIIVSRTRSAPQTLPEFPEDVRQEAHRKSEEYRQTAIRVNELAGAIHSEEDARAFVDAVGKAFSEEIPYELTAPLRERVARAEFAAVTDTSKLVPEQRVVDAWNKWVDDVDGPDEARVSVAELRAMRENGHFTSTSKWANQSRSIWTLSNIYALKANDRVADACRPVEALLLLHQIDSMFVNVAYTREFLAQGKSIEDLMAAREKRQQSDGKAVAYITVSTTLPGASVQQALGRAEQAYFEKHGEIGMSVRVLHLVSQVLGDE
jgi:hypothetical protein